MATTFRIQGVIAPTGVLCRARLYAPDGTTAGDCALTEIPNGSGQYGGSTNISGLSDSTTTPYEYEAREVATQDATGFANSTTIRRSRGDYGYLRSEVWYSEPSTAAENATAIQDDLHLSGEGNSYSATDR